MMEIAFNADKAIAAMQKAPSRTQRAIVRALNRALSAGRTLMVRLIAKDMGVPQKTASGQVWTVQAVPARLEVRLRASLRRVPLIRLNAKAGRGGRVTHRAGADVVYQVSKGRYQPADLSIAFIATMTKSRHVGVFQRATKARLPIHELYGPSFGSVFDRHRPEAIEKMASTFSARLGHELQFAETEN